MDIHREKGPKKILILGCIHSGTSLLTSLIGGHPNIGMLFEDLNNNEDKIYGKDFVGNKLILWHQIRYKQRANRVTHILNRVLNLFRKSQIKIFPSSRKSILDYVKEKAFIITITRNESETRESMRKRMKWLKNERLKEFYCGVVYRQSYKLIDKISMSGYSNFMTIKLENLRNEPEKVLKNICRALGVVYDKRMLDGVNKNWRYSEYKGIQK